MFIFHENNLCFMPFFGKGYDGLADCDYNQGL